MTNPKPGDVWAYGELIEALVILYRLEKVAEEFLRTLLPHLDPYPEAKQRVKAYLQDVKGHSSLVLSCLERMGAKETQLPDDFFPSFNAYDRFDQARAHLLSMTTAQMATYQHAEAYASVTGQEETERIVQRLGKKKHEFLSFLFSDAVLVMLDYVRHRQKEENSKEAMN